MSHPNRLQRHMLQSPPARSQRAAVRGASARTGAGKTLAKSHVLLHKCSECVMSCLIFTEFHVDRSRGWEEHELVALVSYVCFSVVLKTLLVGQLLGETVEQSVVTGR